MADQTSKSNGSGEGSGEAATKEGKSLDELLAEWDADTAKGSKAKGKGDDDAPKGSPTEQEYADRIAALERDAAERSYRADIASVVKEVKGEMQVDDFLVEAWVNSRADRDPRLVELWQNRDQDKARFQTAIKSLGSEFSEWAKERGLARPSTSGSGSGRDRAGGAVASSREAGSARDSIDSVSWGGLSDTEFALKKAEIFSAAKSGAFSRG